MPNSDQSSTPSVDSQISNETSAGAGDAPSGTNTTTSTPPSASASDGNSSSGTKISVAAAIAVNASSSTAQATIPANMVIDASGLLTLASSNTTTGSATATGGAVTSGSSGIAIGAAVAVNYDPAINEATIATGDTITAEGVTLSAINTGANSPTDAFTATTQSGAGGGKIGIAGSVAINIVNDTTEALISPSAAVNAGGGDVTMTAADAATVTTSATPSVDTTGTKFGLGASVALAIVNDSVTAELGNGATLTNANNLSLSAHLLRHRRDDGADGIVGIGRDHALDRHLDRPQHDESRSGNRGNRAAGDRRQFDGLRRSHRQHLRLRDGQRNRRERGHRRGARLDVRHRHHHRDHEPEHHGDSGRSGRDHVPGLQYRRGHGERSRERSGSAQLGSVVDAQCRYADLERNLSGRGDAPSGTNTTTSTPPSASASDGNSSSGTKISVAAAIAVNASSSTAQATIPANMVIDASGLLTLASSNTTTGSATATGGAVTSGSSGIAIGAAVAVNYDPAINQATIATGDTITAKGVTLSAINTGANSPTDAFTATTQSGAGGGKIGIAGSVAINIVNDTTQALISPSAAVNAGGGDVTMTAADAATVTTSATPSVDTTGTKFGLGASVALAIVNDSVTAELGNGATLTNANNLSLSATSSDTVATTAQMGSSGSVAITPSIAISIVHNTTKADLGTVGTAPLAIGGSLMVSAVHTGNTSDSAMANATGESRGHRRGARLDVRHRYHHRDDEPEHHGDSGRSGSDHLPGLQYRRGHGERSRERGGAPNSDQSSTPSVDSQISNETSAGAGDAPSGTNTTTSTPPSASASDGNSSSGTKISVAAAIAVNASSSTAQATIPANTVIDASGLLTLASSNTTTGSATATGGAVTSGSSGIAIGAAVAVNYDPAINEATIATGDTITAKGVTLSAINTGANSPTDAFTATTQSGAGGGKIGIAGSVAINIVNDTTEALISPSAAVNAGGGDVTMTAADAATVTTSATPSVDTTGTKFGLGASVALAIVNDSVTAELGNGATLTGANNLSLSATSSDTVATTAQMGSSGSVAITPSIAISIVHNTTKADLGTVGSSPLSIGGNLTVSAVHDGNTSDSAMANATGESAAIGAGLALTFATDTTTATTSQNITATAAAAGAITFQAFNTGSATASAAASSAGAPTRINRRRPASIRRSRTKPQRAPATHPAAPTPPPAPRPAPRIRRQLVERNQDLRRRSDRRQRLELDRSGDHPGEYGHRRERTLDPGVEQYNDRHRDCHRRGGDLGLERDRHRRGRRRQLRSRDQ